MEAILSSETWVAFQRTTRSYTTQDRTVLTFSSLPVFHHEIIKKTSKDITQLIPYYCQYLRWYGYYSDANVTWMRFRALFFL
jgi:hypothetical protein